MIRTIRVLKALAEWEDNLVEFKWGKTDCVHFADFVTKKITGHSVMPDWAVYGNEDEAHEIVDEKGGFLEALEFALGDSLEPDQLKIGDIALARLPIVGEIVGIHMPYQFVTVHHKGLIQCSDSYEVCGWKV